MEYNEQEDYNNKLNKERDHLLEFIKNSEDVKSFFNGKDNLVYITQGEKYVKKLSYYKIIYVYEFSKNLGDNKIYIKISKSYYDFSIQDNNIKRKENKIFYVNFKIDEIMEICKINIPYYYINQSLECKNDKIQENPHFSQPNTLAAIKLFNGEI